MSRLDGPSPLAKAPRTSPLASVASPPTAPSAPQGGSGTASAAAIGGPSDPLAERKDKQGFYGYPSTMSRIYSAWFHTQTTPDGYKSVSDLIVSTALGHREDEEDIRPVVTVTQLENRYNGGRPFPVVPSGQRKHGKRRSGR